MSLADFQLTEKFWWTIWDMKYVKFNTNFLTRKYLIQAIKLTFLLSATDNT